MSALKRITWISTKNTQRSRFDGNYLPADLRPTAYYTDTDLREVFHTYPSLDFVEFVDGYPVDPFPSVTSARTLDGRNVLCRVDRPIGYEPLRPRFYPIVS